MNYIIMELHELHFFLCWKHYILEPAWSSVFCFMVLNKVFHIKPSSLSSQMVNLHWWYPHTPDFLQLWVSGSFKFQERKREGRWSFVFFYRNTRVVSGTHPIAWKFLEAPLELKILYACVVDEYFKMQSNTWSFTKGSRLEHNLNSRPLVARKALK